MTDRPTNMGDYRNMRGKRLNLYRNKATETPASNLSILGYAIPSLIIFLLLAILIVDPFIGLLCILQYAWWLVLIIAIAAPIVFFRSLKRGGILKRTTLRLSAINLTALILLLFVRMPAYTTDAAEMARHYDRKSEQFDQLVTYAYSASFLQKPRELNRLLRKTGCASIDTSNPEYCVLEYKLCGFDSYGYRVYRAPMSDEEIKTYSGKSEFIPHNSRMVMTYGGGATSELGFPYGQREEYYKKYPRVR